MKKIVNHFVFKLACIIVGSVLVLLASYLGFGFMVSKMKGLPNINLWLFAVLFLLFWMPILLLIIIKFKIFVLKESKAPKLIDYLIFGAVGLFCFLMFMHSDITITANHGIQFLDLLFKGNIREFYITEAHGIGGTAVYDLPTYIIFAVFNLPLYICGIRSANSAPVLLWNQLLLVLFYLGTAYMIYKIIKAMGINKDKAKWGGFLFLLMPFASFSVLVFSQYDIFGTFFFTIATYFFMQKKYYKFVIFASIAITMKPFFLFPILPMILLIEKRPLHIIKYFAIAVSAMVLCKIIQLAFESPDQESFLSDMLSRYLGSGLPGGMAVISFNIIALGVACFFAYRTSISKDNNIDFFAKAIYIPLFIFSIFFITVFWHPQWLVILAPYIILSIFLAKEKGLSFVLDGIAAVAFLIMTPLIFVNNVAENMFGTIWNNVGFNSHGNIANIKIIDMYNSVLRALGINASYLIIVMMSVFCFALIFSLYLKFPTKKRAEAVAKTLNNDDEKVFNRANIWLYGLLIFVFIVPATFLALV